VVRRTGLANLYLWLHGELIAANVAKDAARVAGARALIEPLRDAWHEAARRQLGTGH
jgi:flagellar secretion chaperone FliS